MFEKSFRIAILNSIFLTVKFRKNLLNHSSIVQKNPKGMTFGSPLLDYIIVYAVFLVKSDPANKKVGIADIPKINSQSLNKIGIVWNIGCNGG